MVIKKLVNIEEKKLRKNILHLKLKSEDQLTSDDKNAILIYLAKKFNLIKKH